MSYPKTMWSTEYGKIEPITVISETPKTVMIARDVGYIKPYKTRRHKGPWLHESFESARDYMVRVNTESAQRYERQAEQCRERAAKFAAMKEPA